VVPRFGQCHSGMGGVHRAASSPTEGRENDRPGGCVSPRMRPPSSGRAGQLGQSADATNKYLFRLKK
jgi:hypothetical protein